MKLLVDMNLSPNWVPALIQEGWEAVHWVTVGAHSAPDHEILNWARENEYVLFTHDLDFGALLAASETEAPSVVQIRTQDVNPQHIKELVFGVLRQFQNHIEKGALITVDEDKSRVRILPLMR